MTTQHLGITMRKCYTQHIDIKNNESCNAKRQFFCNAKCHYAECRYAVSWRHACFAFELVKSSEGLVYCKDVF
jgi:hypothetical protein